MALFGSFETEREVYSDPIYTVYGAKRSGETKADYAVKVFSIQRVGFDEDTSTELAPLLLDIESARLQCIELQSRGAGASKCIAPVFDKGQDERGVWYVTWFYPRSVNKLIIGKVALTRDALHHLIRAIAQGALDFKQTCGRSHGDIRPSNIQISRSEKLSEAEVVLCDPLPGGEEESVNFEINDLRSIGRILLQLVRQRAITNEDDFLILPILSSPEWTRIFGKETEAWLSICNRLLDPNLSLEEMTLERLLAELRQFEPKRRVEPKWVLAGAGALVLLGVVVLVLMRPHPRSIELTTDPPGATVLVDQKQQAQVTPLKVKLDKGPHVIEVRQPRFGLQSLSTNFAVQSGTPSRLRLQFAYGSVSIKSQPAGASIRSGGAIIGKTSSDPAGFVIPIVPAGAEVAYDLILEDHATRTVRGVVSSGQRLLFNETLPLSSEVGTIDMDSTPPGARVFWKDKLLTTATPDRVQLEQGTYTLRAQYKDWPEKQVTVDVASRKIVPAVFNFESGLVSLDSDPPGANVFIGTNLVGTTPRRVLRPAGETSFRFELTGFESTNVVVRVANKSTPDVRAKLVSNNGLFEFTSDPPDAVILDGKGTVLGQTHSGQALRQTRVPGNYVFKAHIDGLADVQAELTVTKRQVLPYTFQFKYGSVAISSEPSGAAVSVDDKVLGLTPKTFIQKPGLKVTYRISAQDYVPSTNEVAVQDREFNQPLVIRLRPEPVSVRLTSQPPGAVFYSGENALVASGPAYLLPWGTNIITARNVLYPWLADVTEQLVIHKGTENAKQFHFQYGTVSFETIPPDADAAIYDGTRFLGRTPTNLFIRPGPAQYTLVCGDQTNRVGTNVVQDFLHRLISAFEVKRDYTNSVGMILVRVKDPLYVSKFEITQEQYQRVMGRPVDTKPRGPVVNVKWADAQAFCQKLSQMEAGSDAARKARVGGWVYGVPTQAEWSRFAENDPNQLLEAVFDATLSEAKEIDFNRKSSNHAGLYDLYGNVAEWCLGPNNQPITIGGSFVMRKPRQIPPDLLVETRLDRSISDGSPNIGLRCVLRPGP